MKSLFKSFVLIALAVVLTGCENNNWQTITCDIQTYAGNVFRDGNTLSYGESRDINGYLNISFKLPKEYYQADDSGDYHIEKTWSNGSTTIAIYGIKIVEAEKYFEYEKSAYKTGQSNTSEQERITLTNGVVKSTVYPRVDSEGTPLADNEPSIHGHLVDTTLGSHVIRFTVYEYCSKDSPVISEKTIEFIQAIADSFRYEKN